MNCNLITLMRVWCDFVARQRLLRLSEPVIPWSISAMRPSGLLRVIQDVSTCRGDLMVECGGGTSTFYLGEMLRATGRHLVTVEHDPEWAMRLRGLVCTRGLESTVTVVTAPLAPYTLAHDTPLWYDTGVLTAFFSGQRIDVLLVDGPPAYEQTLSRARYPALPFFYRYLSPSALIFLDDIDRGGEQAIMRQWNAEFNLALTPARPWQRIACGRN